MQPDYHFSDVNIHVTSGLRSFFSCAFMAGVVTILLTVPKALRPDGRGVCNFLAATGVFISFSVKKQIMGYIRATSCNTTKTRDSVNN